MSEAKELAKLKMRIQNMNNKVLKCNLRKLIKQKYPKRGWRIEVSNLLEMNYNTFVGMINQANTGRIPPETLLHIVDVLGLDITELLAKNNITTSTQQKYEDMTRWTTETKTEFLTDYKYKGLDYTVKKYNLYPMTVKTYVNQFGKKIKIL